MNSPDSTAPAVSVVLVAYNRAQVLPRTLDSLLAQTYADFELIVSDDCSTDETESVVRRYEDLDERVRYRRNDTNLSMPGNLNAAIRDSQGEFIANLHDGDVYDPSLLEEWVDALERCEGAAFVFNAYRLLNREGDTVRIFKESLPQCVPGSQLLEQIFFRRWRFDSPVWGTVMARRSAYEATGLFDERFGFCSDVDMWMRFAGRYRVAYVSKPLISLAGKDELASGNPEEYWHQRRLAYRMFLEARERHYAGRKVLLAREKAKHYLFVALFAVYYCALWIRRELLFATGRRTRPS
jgi:glycosyltransferase involved in cell wall biosynthesis